MHITRIVLTCCVRLGMATSVFLHLSVHKVNLNINLNTYLAGKQISLQLARVPGTTGRSVSVFHRLTIDYAVVLGRCCVD